MNSISIVSTLAMAVGLAAALPQILQMMTSRSSGGQSVLGWGMGLVTNLSMAYVNLFGFGAKALMASNLLSGSLCVIAMLMISRFGEPADDEPAASASSPRFTHDPAGSVVAPAVFSREHLGTLIEMPTTEFAALRQVVLEIDEARERPQRAHRSGERELALAAA